MADPTSGSTDKDSIMKPIEGGAAVTPHDSNELATATRGLFVGVSGNVKVTTTGGSEITFTGLAAGVIHPIRAKLVWATGTTATSILALW